MRYAAYNLAFSLVFMPYLSNGVVLAQSTHFFHALAELKMLVSLISRFVACSPRIVVDRQTDKQTDIQNDSSLRMRTPSVKDLGAGR